MTDADLLKKIDEFANTAFPVPGNNSTTYVRWKDRLPSGGEAKETVYWFIVHFVKTYYVSKDEGK